jgi:hypothetical protein
MVFPNTMSNDDERITIKEKEKEKEEEIPEPPELFYKDGEMWIRTPKGEEIKASCLPLGHPYLYFGDDNETQ